jgi:UDP-3-O-[3-hydroxymyristoyl] N-acetylglucosamine deacetylase
MGNLSLESKGLISRSLVKAELIPNKSQGLRFISPKGNIIEADISNLYSTQRNTVLAKDSECICLTEHFLAAASLMNLNDIDIKLSDYELPFGDGSAALWVEFFERNGLGGDFDKNEALRLQEEILIQKDGRYIELKASEVFKVTYKLNWPHPKVGEQEYTWEFGKNKVNDIAIARTFSSETENQMLGLSGWIIGLTEDDITVPLHFGDEPARHKVLDLIGDLSLCGMNPLNIRMHVISHQGGHELNAMAARRLAQLKDLVYP